jgi:acyl-CoA synthetase (AMP-forming)/AMP-acid ligase II
MNSAMARQSPYDAFMDTARKRPGAPFLIAPASAGLAYAPDGFHLTYGEASAEVARLRHAYAAAGYGRGSRVALLLENRPAFFSHWLALNSLGVSIVPGNPDLRPDELTFQLGMAEADLLVCVPERVDTVRGGDLAGARIVCLGDEPPPCRVPVTGQTGGENDECALLFTSGSTGKPKGCLLSNFYFLRLADWYVTQGGIATMTEGDETVLTPLPMFHMNALGCSTVGIILVGGAVVPLDRFHASRWWQTVCDSGATIVHCLGVIPAILLQLPGSELERRHRVRFALGPGVDARHKGVFEERTGIPIVEAWAMTETGGAAATSTAGEETSLGPRCIGRARVGMDYRLVDDSGRDIGLGAPGELLVRASGSDPRHGFFSGYLKDATATEEAWSGGWFHTGDLVTADSDGLLYFFDRKKSIVRRSGENIAVLEVEAALAIDASIKVAAVTPVPDELRGEEVFAFIVRATGATDASGGDALRVLAEKIVATCALQIAYHKVPGYVAFVDELPLSSTQKLQRGEIRMAAARKIAEGEAIDLRDLKGRLRNRRPAEAAT